VSDVRAIFSQRTSEHLQAAIVTCRTLIGLTWAGEAGDESETHLSDAAAVADITGS